MTREYRVSVVISTRNRVKELRTCLQSVAKAVSANDEVIVVDSASDHPQELKTMVSEFNVALLRSEKAGSARARNMGVLAARGAIVAFTDDDAIVDPGWLDTLVGAFADGSVDAVVGPVFALESDPPEVLTPGLGFDAATSRVRFSREDDNWFARMRYGAVGFGANLAVTRAGFEKYGMFRQGLGAGACIGGDENYFLLSVVEGGGVVLNEPNARVFHPRQDDARLQEWQQQRVAYVLYILVTRPRLFGLLMSNLLRKAGSSGPKQSASGAAGRSLLRELVTAPWLVMQAVRMDRSPRQSPPRDRLA